MVCWYGETVLVLMNDIAVVMVTHLITMRT